MAKCFKEKEMKEMLKNAEIGDRVWSVLSGWGTLVRIDEGEDYPFVVKYSDCSCRKYDEYGKRLNNDLNPELYWSEIKFETPKKSLPDLEKDTRVIVWNGFLNDEHNAYFSHFDEDGRIHCFAYGATSWSSTGVIADWDYWRLAGGE
jgi:hypothetical protein